MIIDTLTLENFQCFQNKTIVPLCNLTAFIGSNGTGKTAVLIALARLFATDKALQTIINSDFFTNIGEALEDKSERSLTIEITLKFPELMGEESDTSVIPDLFQHMIIRAPGDTPYCRIRLEANWYNSDIPGGSIDQSIYWITSSEDVITDDQKIPMKAYERSKIQVHYIPATRDPYKHLKQSSNSIMYQLLRSVLWSKATKDNVDIFIEQMRQTFQNENGLKTIQSSFTEYWTHFFTSDMYQSININPTGASLEKLLSKIEISFTPAPGGNEESIERLSDGMKSLFYFTLICSIFDLQNRVLEDEGNVLGINIDEMKPPLLSIFAIEEPENHLAPHYIGRILKLYRKIAQTPRAQILVTSHSPSIMKRIEPEEVRYLKLDSNRCTKISKITLPDEANEALKYVKEAIKAYPELYFSKLVVLGEGDSEEIIIPKIAEAFDIPIDESFVSIVPLGGRYVNHFWRLLRQLEIPYITLLDYDRERSGGDWGRIKYVLNQLIENGVPKEDILTTTKGILSDELFKKMHTWAKNEEIEKGWIDCLKSQGIYFSYPIDIDFMMFTSYPEAYKALAPTNGGPSIPKNGSSSFDTKTQQVIASVLKKEDSGQIDLKNYPDYENYYWYRYLFLGRGKPTSHVEALAKISMQDLKDKCPSILKELVENINTILIGK